MTSKEYYKSTRMVETRNWTLEMALNFAEEYAEALRKHDVSGSLCDYCKDNQKAVCCQTCLDEMINQTANTQ